MSIVAIQCLYIINLKVLMGFRNGSATLLFPPSIPIFPEVSMYPTVEKKPRTTRWLLRGPVFHREQVVILKYIENLSRLQPSRLHFTLQLFYIETWILLLHRAGRTNSRPRPR
jgi:hypothetical protein